MLLKQPFVIIKIQIKKYKESFKQETLIQEIGEHIHVLKANLSQK
jgi:hypothetical protein